MPVAAYSVEGAADGGAAARADFAESAPPCAPGAFDAPAEPTEPALAALRDSPTGGTSSARRGSAHAVSGIGFGSRSRKNTAEMIPRSSILPSRAPYDLASVVNSKRRASDMLVCQPLIVTDPNGSITHLRAAVGVVWRASIVLSPSTDSATA